MRAFGTRFLQFLLLTFFLAGSPPILAASKQADTRSPSVGDLPRDPLVDVDSLVTVEVRTELGSFVVDLYPEQAPVTVANFLRYVDAGFYTDGSFHRTVHADNQPNDSVRIAVIQGDISREWRGERFGAIPLERTTETGLLHVDGSVSMARSGPDSATSSFFVCVGDQPSLDFGGNRNLDGQGFAAFGRVVDGMDVVRAINRSPAEGQSLTPPIRVLEVVRVPSGV